MTASHGYCKIVLAGWFDLQWANYLEDMQFQEQETPNASRSTTLSGRPRDLEACLGLLHMLVDRGLQVQAVEYRQATPGAGLSG